MSSSLFKRGFPPRKADERFSSADPCVRTVNDPQSAPPRSPSPSPPPPPGLPGTPRPSDLPLEPRSGTPARAFLGLWGYDRNRSPGCPPARTRPAPTLARAAWATPRAHGRCSARQPGAPMPPAPREVGGRTASAPPSPPPAARSSSPPRAPTVARSAAPRSALLSHKLAGKAPDHPAGGYSRGGSGGGEGRGRGAEG